MRGIRTIWVMLKRFLSSVWSVLFCTWMILPFTKEMLLLPWEGSRQYFRSFQFLLVLITDSPSPISFPAFCCRCHSTSRSDFPFVVVAQQYSNLTWVFFYIWNSTASLRILFGKCEGTIEESVSLPSFLLKLPHMSQDCYQRESHL